MLQRIKQIFQTQGRREIIKKALYFPLELCYILFYALTLDRISRSLGAERLVDMVFNGCHGILRPFQVYSEILQLALLIEEKKPQTVVEIGTAGGGTLFLFCRLASQKSRIISIDLPNGEFGGGYHPWRIPLYKGFASRWQKLFLLQADSHSDATSQKVKTILGESKIDLLFLDGDHSYEGIKKDFNMYCGLVKKGGMIVFHDIAKTAASADCKVNMFWDQIKHQYRNKELVENKDQTGSGIGIIFYE
jgi:predicted O-methyltransferase YrrM